MTICQSPLSLELDDWSVSHRCRWDLFFLEFHINGVQWNILFCLWLLSLSMFLRFIPVITYAKIHAIFFFFKNKFCITCKWVWLLIQSCPLFNTLCKVTESGNHRAFGHGKEVIKNIFIQPYPWFTAHEVAQPLLEYLILLKGNFFWSWLDWPIRKYFFIFSTNLPS